MKRARTPSSLPWFKSPLSSAALVDLLQDEDGLTPDEQQEVARAAADVELSGRLEKCQRTRMIALAKKYELLPRTPGPCRPKQDKPFSMQEWIDSKHDVRAGAAAYDAMVATRGTALANRPPLRRVG